MKKLFGFILGAGLVLGLTLASSAFALDPDFATDRDLIVKEGVHHSASLDVNEVGEVEKDNDHLALHEDHESKTAELHESEVAETHEVMHEDHESLTAEHHESAVAEKHDSGIK